MEERGVGEGGRGSRRGRERESAREGEDRVKGREGV